MIGSDWIPDWEDCDGAKEKIGLIIFYIVIIGAILIQPIYQGYLMISQKKKWNNK